MPGRSPMADEVRIDKWLWAARFYKTRALAQSAIENGRVSIDGQRVKPARAVRIGDTIWLRAGDREREVVVRGLSAVRGPAPVAQALYREHEASRLAREEAARLRRAARDGYRPPQSRPDKRARRLLRALGDIDAL